MNYWEGVREVFQKEETDYLQETLRDDDLEYNGREPVCWGCEFPIHLQHKSRSFKKNKLHIGCFKKIKAIAKRRGMDGL